MKKIIINLEKQVKALEALIQKREDKVNDASARWQESEACDNWLDETECIEDQLNELVCIIDNLKNV